jgi:hypothetical protein
VRVSCLHSLDKSYLSRAMTTGYHLATHYICSLFHFITYLQKYGTLNFHFFQQQIQSQIFRIDMDYSKSQETPQKATSSLHTLSSNKSLLSSQDLLPAFLFPSVLSSIYNSSSLCCAHYFLTLWQWYQIVLSYWNQSFHSIFSWFVSCKDLYTLLNELFIYLHIEKNSFILL